MKNGEKALNRKGTNIWTLVHSLGCLSAAIFLYRGMDRPHTFYALIFISFGLASFSALFLIQRRGVLNLPNFISLVRLFAGLAALEWFAQRPSLHPAKFLLLLAALLSDFFDGFMARRKGPTPFGRKLDMEVDAFFTLLLSLMGYLFLGMGAWILLTGLMRYCYVFVLLITPDLRKLPRPLGFVEKSVCAFTVVCLVYLSAPFHTPSLKWTLALCALIMLSISFLADFIVRVSCRSLRLFGEKEF
jgi:phosphatidylglycerophosphate synthase